MQSAAHNKLRSRWLEVGLLTLGGFTFAVAPAACSNDPIVYPNRNLRAATGGDTSASGAAGEAGEAGAESGGSAHGGSGGTNASGGKGGGKGGSGGNAGHGGAPPVVGPICGDGKLEAPEECDDGNTRSGDGCAWDCRTACEICEQNVCPTIFDEFAEPATASAYDDCYKAVGKIGTGPATGYPRAEVCQELIDCMREEGCSQIKAASLLPQSCWCDKDWTDLKGKDGVGPVTACTTDPDPNSPADPKRFTPGKCASLFQDASEGPALKDVTKGLVAYLLAEGRALRLLTVCDTRECTEECLPTYFNKGGIANITADIVHDRNPAGESPLGDLVADSQRSVAAADFALVHSQFIVSNDSVPDLQFAPTPYRAADAPGLVLWSEALRVSFGHSQIPLLGQSPSARATDSLYTVTFTGQQIYDALNQQFDPSVGGTMYISGMRYEWDAAQPIASRIVNVFKTGSQTPLDKATTYTVAVSGFLIDTVRSPIPALTRGTNATLVPNIEISQLLGEYLKQLPQPVAPPELNRIVRLN
jgi:cysteine-rich repeat protein